MAEESKNKWSTPIWVTVLHGLLTGYLALSEQVAKNQLSQLEIQSKQVKNGQDTVSFDNDIKLKVYDLTIKSLESTNLKEQKAAQIVVENVLRDDRFKAGLLALFRESPNVPEGIKDAVTISQLKIDASKRDDTLSLSRTNKTFVDIIYYEPEADSTRPIAEKIYQALRNSSYYTARIKSLSEKTNSQPAYNVKRNVVRFDDGEQRIATTLVTVLGEILKQEKISFTTEQTAKGKPTSNYLSLFVINDD